MRSVHQFLLNILSKSVTLPTTCWYHYILFVYSILFTSLLISYLSCSLYCSLKVRFQSSSHFRPSFSQSVLLLLVCGGSITSHSYVIIISASASVFLLASPGSSFIPIRCRLGATAGMDGSLCLFHRPTDPHHLLSRPSPVTNNGRVWYLPALVPLVSILIVLHLNHISVRSCLVRLGGSGLHSVLSLKYTTLSYLISILLFLVIFTQYFFLLSF